MASAGAALFRSVATKMARAPPRLATTSGGNLLSRFSTSAGGSVPPPANLRDPHQTYNKKVPSGSERLHRFIAGANNAANKAAFGLLLGGCAFLHFYAIPAMDRISAGLDALCDDLRAFNEEMKQQDERHAALSSTGSQIEARDEVGGFSKGERMQASGQGKEHL